MISRVAISRRVPLENSNIGAAKRLEGAAKGGEVTDPHPWRGNDLEAA